MGLNLPPSVRQFYCPFSSSEKVQYKRGQNVIDLLINDILPVSWTASQHWNIVLFKSLRNSKRHNKGNFKKIKLCGGGGQHYLV